VEFSPKRARTSVVFAGAVLPDKDGELTAVNMHGNILQQLLPAAADGNIAQVYVTQGATVKMHTVNTP